MKYIITTLGCKVNQYETQAMETILNSHGHRAAAPGESVDAVIINTCAVTAESGRKSRQTIRRLRDENPGAVLAVCGCYSQIEPDEIEKLGAKVIFGAADRAKLVEAVEKAVSEGESCRNIDEPFKRRAIEKLPAGAASGRTRAMLKIQDGCVNFCSYCIIPYARGPVRSLPLDRAVAQIEELARAGYREVVINGIEISSWGRDLPGSPPLIELLEALSAAAPGLRIRLGSLEPRTIDEDFCRRASSLHNICPHFHLSLQSGCDKTLKAMNRKYDTARYAQSVALLRKCYGNPAITTDLIVGFPGERWEDFQESLAFVEEMAFSALHIFPYSRRPGTPADKLPGQVPGAEKKRRAALAAQVARRLQLQYLQGLVGQELEVLFEEEKEGLWQGHAPNYVVVRAKGEGLHNVLRRVRITGVEDGAVVGEIL